MATNKNTFQLYIDQDEYFNELSDEMAGKLIKLIFQYVNGEDDDDDPIIENPILKMAFLPIKLQLKRDLVSWRSSKDGKSTRGSLGNLKRWHPNIYKDVVSEKITLKEGVAKGKEQSQKSQSDVNNPKIAVTVTDTDTDTDTDTKIPFGDFWNLYNKKSGNKSKLEKKWDGFSLTIQTEIMEFIPKYTKHQPDSKYRLNPQTFFNQKKWMDEEINQVSKKANRKFKMVPGRGLRYLDEKTGRYTIQG